MVSATVRAKINMVCPENELSRYTRYVSLCMNGMKRKSWINVETVLYLDETDTRAGDFAGISGVRIRGLGGAYLKRCTL